MIRDWGAGRRLIQPPLQRCLLSSRGNIGVRRNAHYSRATSSRKTVLCHVGEPIFCLLPEGALLQDCSRHPFAVADGKLVATVTALCRTKMSLRLQVKRLPEPTN
jgi:hypothetical protein